MRRSKPAALRYTDTMVTFSEIPGEITLCVNIAGCPHRCEGCHSPELRRTDIGQKLTVRNLTWLVEHNKGITCVCLMGGDANPLMVSLLGTVIKNSGLKSVLYSGNDKLDKDISLGSFDYIKLGHYDKELGGLDKETTNQRFYEVAGQSLIDRTYLFWRKNQLEEQNINIMQKTEAKEWYDRVIDEQNELCAKIKKLKEALESEGLADSAGEKNVILLKEQICHMLRYALVLDARLEMAGKERLLYNYVSQPDVDSILDQ